MRLVIRRGTAAVTVVLMVLVGACSQRYVTGTPGSSGGQRSAGVVGRITASGGDPVQGAIVKPTSREDPSPPVPMLLVRSDRDGRYSWSLPSGTWDIAVSAEGYQPATDTIVIPEGSSVTLDFVLER